MSINDGQPRNGSVLLNHGHYWMVSRHNHLWTTPYKDHRAINFLSPRSARSVKMSTFKKAQDLVSVRSDKLPTSFGCHFWYHVYATYIIRFIHIFYLFFILPIRYLLSVCYLHAISIACDLLPMSHVCARYTRIWSTIPAAFDLPFVTLLCCIHIATTTHSPEPTHHHRLSTMMFYQHYSLVSD